MIKNKKSILEESDIEIAKNKLEFGKKQQKILDIEQKEILAIYQTCKAYISRSKVKLLDDGVPRINKVFLSYGEMLENIKRELAGTVGLELIKNEKYSIGEDAIKRAYEIASLMIQDYKMAQNIEEIIKSAQDSLKDELMRNIDNIARLKELMLKNEVITLEDLQ